MTRLIERRARGSRELLRLDAEDCGLRAPRVSWVGSGGEAAAADWMTRRFGRGLPAGCDLLVLDSPLSPAALVALAFVNPGDRVSVPDPGPAALRTAALLAGGEIVPGRAAGAPGDREALGAGGVAAAGGGGFAHASPARLAFLSPCGPPAGLPEPFGEMGRAVDGSLRSSRILAADISSLLLDLAAAPPVATLLAHPRGAAAGVEIVAFDELFGAGRSPFSIVAGNEDVVAGVRRLAAMTGIRHEAPSARALGAALDEIDALSAQARATLRSHRDAVAEGLQRLGFRTALPVAGLSLFSSVPRGYNALAFARMLLRRAAILVRPGVDYGELGEGGFAVSLAAPRDVLLRALGRLEELAPRVLRLRRQLSRTRRARGRDAM
jgi:LL-diaminopimelate aminotransferase